MYQVLIPIEVEIDVDFDTPGKAHEILGKMGARPLLPLPSYEWDAPHDNRRAAAELLLADLALDRMRVLLQRGLLREQREFGEDGYWREEGPPDRPRLVQIRDWQEDLLYDSSRNPVDGLPEETSLRRTGAVSVEVFGVSLGSPARKRAGFWARALDNPKIIDAAAALVGLLCELAPKPAVAPGPQPPPSVCEAHPTGSPILRVDGNDLTVRQKQAQDTLYGAMSSSNKSYAATTVQRALAELGCYSGRVDGDFGPVSREAAKTFLDRFTLAPIDWTSPRFLTLLSREQARLTPP